MGFNKKFFQTGGIVASSPAAAAFDPLQNFETVTYTGNGGTQKITGYIRKGAAFNGSSSKIQINQDIIPSNDFSISMWFNVASLGSKQYLHYLHYYGVFIDTNNYINFYTNSNLIYSTALSANTWYHLTLVKSSTSGKFIYLNGSEVATDATDTGNVSSSFATYSKGYIGAGIYNASTDSDWFNGKIDQVRIFNKALSSSEVTTLYGETYASSTKSTTDIFGDGSGVALYELDDSANDTGITGTAIDSGQSAVFNGSSSYIDTSVSVLPATNYSVSMWVLHNSLKDGCALYTQYRGSVTGRHIVNSNANGTIQINTSSTNSLTSITATPFTTGVWQHLVITKSSSAGYTVYINGSSIGTWSSTESIITDESTQFGGDTEWSGDHWLDGKIDDVRIYSDVLTSTEVGYIYNNTTASIPTDYIAYYKLDGDATDETGTYNGTASNITYSDPALVGQTAYNGTATNVNFLGMAFQPDLVWIKERTATGWHHLFDSVRGTGKALFSNATNAELSRTDTLTSFDSNGFSLGADSNGDGVNRSYNYVAWCFKGGGTAVSNTDGTITSTVSANQDAGFSIVNFTSPFNGQTAGHGLSTTPEMIILKIVNSTSNWYVWTKDLTSGNSLGLNLTRAENTDLAFTVNSTTFTTNWTNTNYEYIAYCFHSVDGYQKIGSYTGNSPTTVSVTTGFRPRFLLVKSYSVGSAKDWVIYDDTRGIDQYLLANTSTAEGTYNNVDLTENGFDIVDTGSSLNQNGTSYIYLAIA